MIVKIVSYECPRKGCGYTWVPGTGIGGQPHKGLGNRSWRRGRRTNLAIVPACPKCMTNLVRHSEKIKAEDKKNDEN